MSPHSLAKIVNQKNIVSGVEVRGMAEISATLKDLKDVGVVVPFICLFNPLVCPL